ncbi:hypothetical protein C7B80_21765 [Cyanosarcina cf. burmensis CCALA 770]|nr:hypothetical protein C7B80_21765 [Cyanosarcina cf. burmensis CCALA 770]
METQTQVAAVEIFEELTPDEERERHRLETRVDRALGEGWSALKQLRDRRLYRSTHKTFEEYAKDRFGYNRAHAYRLIQAAGVIENLSPNGRQIDEMSPIGRHLLPKSERLCRELAKLPSTAQPIVWERVLEVSGDAAPTASVVRSIVEQLKQKPRLLASDYCFEGEVFFLQRLIGDEKKYNSCWAIAIEVENRFTVKAAVYDGTLELRQENMKPIDLQQTQAEIAEIYKRITQLQQIGSLDRGANHFLEGIGKQIYLTEVEEMLLSCLEKYYQLK